MATKKLKVKEQVTGPRQPYRDNHETGKFVTRMIEAYGLRVAGKHKHSSAPDIEAFAELIALRDEVDRQIAAAAVALHEGTDDSPGYSWTEIGRVLGITRQSAREKFMRHADDSEDTGSPSEPVLGS